jgi:hypothetical protein
VLGHLTSLIGFEVASILSRQHPRQLRVASHRVCGRRSKLVLPAADRQGRSGHDRVRWSAALSGAEVEVSSPQVDYAREAM